MNRTILFSRQRFFRQGTMVGRILPPDWISAIPFAAQNPTLLWWNRVHPVRLLRVPGLCQNPLRDIWWQTVLPMAGLHNPDLLPQFLLQHSLRPRDCPLLVFLYGSYI